MTSHPLVERRGGALLRVRLLERVCALAASLLVVTGTAVAQTAAAPVTPALTRPDLESWLDGVVPYALDSNDIAGALIVVVKNGEVLLEKGYGYADVAKKIPMDPDHSEVEVASVSKTFTWTAVMQLVEQGRLDLDRNVDAYLDFKIPPAFGQPITLRELMTHTAGFEERIKSYLTADSPRSLREYLRSVEPPTRIYSPGTVQAYSNYGAMLAGYIVERVSGEPYATYIQRHILDPLHMLHSTMARPLPAALRAGLAKNYQLASADPIPPDAVAELKTDPAGSLLSTADDMSHFMLMHLLHGRLGEQQVLRSATTDQMHAVAFIPMPGAQGTALGFFYGDYNGHRIILHDGDGSGNHTDMELLLDDEVGFFSFVNSDGPGGFVNAAYALRASLLHHFMDRYFPAAPVRDEPTLSTAKDHAAAVAGEYEMSRRPANTFMRALYLAARVTVKANDDGTIETPAFIDFEHGRPQTWREVGPFSWREVGGHARLDMKIRQGHIEGWLPHDLTTFLFQPVPYTRSRAMNLPPFIAASSVLLLTTFAWPVAAIARRRCGRRLALEPRAARAHRWTRIAALAGCLFALSWAVLLLVVSSGVASFDAALDPWIRVIQLIGISCVAGTSVAIYNAWITCTGPRSVWARLWSIVLVAALLDLLWFSFTFSLISSSLNY